MHYCGVCTDPETIWDILIEGGCDPSVCDKLGHPPTYYLEHISKIALPGTETMDERKSTNGRSECKFIYSIFIDNYVFNCQTVR